MPKLRPTSVQRLKDQLEDTRFGLVGFEVKFPDTYNVLANVTFTGAKGFTLKVGESSQNKVYVNCAPGEFKAEDTYVFDTFDEALDCIKPWSRRIYEDLRVKGEDLNELAAFRQRLDAYLKESVQDEQGIFTDAEVDDISTKLSALEQRLAEMEEKHLLTEKELNQLKQVLSDARNDLPELPKGVWYRTAGGKIWEVMKKAAGTSEARQVLADAAKKLLGL